MNASIESATSCSYPSIRQFLISDTRVYLEATQHFEGEEDSGMLKYEFISENKNFKVQISVHFELAEPLLISDIQLQSGCLELSKKAFSFIGAYQKIDSQDEQPPIEMVKLNKYLFKIPQNAQGLRLGVIGIAQAIWLKFETVVNPNIQQLKEQAEILGKTSELIFQKIKQMFRSQGQQGEKQDQGKFAKKEGEEGREVEEEDEANKQVSKQKDTFSPQEILLLFKACFSNVELFGFPIDQAPQPSLGIVLLNTSTQLRRAGKSSQAMIAEYLYGLSLFKCRKLVAASEVFTKLRDSHLQIFLMEIEDIEEENKRSLKGQEELLKSKISLDYLINLIQSFYCDSKAQIYSQNTPNFQREQLRACLIIENASLTLNFNLVDGSSHPCLLNAAKMEILKGDIQSDITKKITCYYQAVQLYTCFTFQYDINTKNNNLDGYLSLLSMKKELISFCLKLITQEEQSQTIQISAVNTLYFLVEQLGCSLSTLLQLIIQQSILNYPSNKLDQSLEQSNSNKSPSQQQADNPAAASISPLKTAFHRLLESVINVLASASSQILRDIFEESISPSLLRQEMPCELKLYIFRIAEKVLAICQGDIKVDLNLFHYMLFAVDEETEGINQEIHCNQALRLWETMKVKVIYNMNLSCLNEVVCWIEEMLLVLLEEDQESSQYGNDSDFRSSVLSKVFQLLDLMTIIAVRNKDSFLMNEKNLESKSDTYIKIQSSSEISNPLIITGGFSPDKQQQQSPEQQQQSQQQQAQQQQQQQAEESTNLIVKYFKKLPENKRREQICMPLWQNEQNPINIHLVIEPLILWIENCVKKPNEIEVFRNLWLVLSECTRYQNKYNLFSIISPLLLKLTHQMKSYPPTSEQLQFISIVISTLESQKSLNTASQSPAIILNLFNAFIKQIPSIHPANQEITFSIFNSLLDFSKNNISLQLISVKYCNSPKPFQLIFASLQFFYHLHILYQDCIDALTDEFTPKGSFYYEAVICFCRTTLNNDQAESFLHLMQVVLNDDLIDKLSQSSLNNRNKKVQSTQQAFNDKLSILLTSSDYLQDKHFELFLQETNLEKLEQTLSNLMKQNFTKLKIKSILFLKVILKRFLLVTVKSISPSLPPLDPDPKSSQPALIENSYKQQANIIQQGQQTNQQTSNFSCLDEFCKIAKSENNSLENVSIHHLAMSKFILRTCKQSLSSANEDCKSSFNALLVLDLLFQTLLSGPSIYAIFKSKQNKEQNQILNEGIKPSEKSISRCSPDFLLYRIEEIIVLLPLITPLVSSSWSNIRSLTYGLLCYWVKPFLVDYQSERKRIVDSMVFKIVNDLLLSYESECRTGGLNILGSLCGLGYDFDQLPGDAQTILQFFRESENTVPQYIWEAVYAIQFDWDTTNQAASHALIQLCAPKMLVAYLFEQGLKFPIHMVQTKQCFYFNNNLLSFIRENRSNNSERLFWVEKLELQDIKDYVSMFRNEYQPPVSLWIEKSEYNNGVDIQTEIKMEEISQSQYLNVDADTPFSDEQQIESIQPKLESNDEKNSSMKAGRLRSYGRFQDEDQQQEAQDAWISLQNQGNEVIQEVDEENLNDEDDQKEDIHSKQENGIQNVTPPQENLKERVSNANVQNEFGQISPRDFLRNRKQEKNINQENEDVCNEINQINEVEDNIQEFLNSKHSNNNKHHENYQILDTSSNVPKLLFDTSDQIVTTHIEMNDGTPHPMIKKAEIIPIRDRNSFELVISREQRDKLTESLNGINKKPVMQSTGKQMQDNKRIQRLGALGVNTRDIQKQPKERMVTTSFETDKAADSSKSLHQDSGQEIINKDSVSIIEADISIEQQIKQIEQSLPKQPVDAIINDGKEQLLIEIDPILKEQKKEEIIDNNGSNNYHEEEESYRCEEEEKIESMQRYEGEEEKQQVQNLDDKSGNRFEKAGHILEQQSYVYSQEIPQLPINYSGKQLNFPTTQIPASSTNQFIQSTSQPTQQQQIAYQIENQKNYQLSQPQTIFQPQNSRTNSQQINSDICVEENIQNIIEKCSIEEKDDRDFIDQFNQQKDSSKNIIIPTAINNSKRKPKEFLRLCDSLDFSTFGSNNSSIEVKSKKSNETPNNVHSSQMADSSKNGIIIDQIKTSNTSDSGKNNNNSRYQKQYELSIFQAPKQFRSISDRSKEIAYRGNDLKNQKKQPTRVNSGGKQKRSEGKQLKRRQNKTFDGGKKDTMSFNLHNSSNSTLGRVKSQMSQNFQNDQSQSMNQTEKVNSLDIENGIINFIDSNIINSKTLCRSKSNSLNLNGISNTLNSVSLNNNQQQYESISNQLSSPTYSNMEKLIKKLLSNKGLNQFELKSVVKLQQSTKASSSMKLFSPSTPSIHKNQSRSGNPQILNSSLDEFNATHNLKKQIDLTENSLNFNKKNGSSCSDDKILHLNGSHQSNPQVDLIQQPTIRNESPMNNNNNHNNNTNLSMQNLKEMLLSKEAHQNTMFTHPNNQNNTSFQQSNDQEGQSQIKIGKNGSSHLPEQIQTTSTDKIKSNKHKSFLSKELKQLSSIVNPSDNQINNLKSNEHSKNISSIDHSTTPSNQNTSSWQLNSKDKNMRRTNSIERHLQNYFKSEQIIKSKISPSRKDSETVVSSSICASPPLFSQQTTKNKNFIPLTLAVLAASQKRQVVSPSQVDKLLGQNKGIQTNSLKKSQSSLGQNSKNIIGVHKYSKE